MKELHRFHLALAAAGVDNSAANRSELRDAAEALLSIMPRSEFIARTGINWSELQALAAPANNGSLWE